MVSGYAGVAELVDALAWGLVSIALVEVQVFPHLKHITY